MHQIAFPVDHGIDMAAAISRLPDHLSAIEMCIRVSGRDPKHFYIDIEIDKGHWSRIMAGSLSFSTDKLDRLMDIAGNDIPLQWLAYRRGKGLHLLESEQQRLMREQVLMEAIRGRA